MTNPCFLHWSMYTQEFRNVEKIFQTYPKCFSNWLSSIWKGGWAILKRPILNIFYLKSIIYYIYILLEQLATSKYLCQNVEIQNLRMFLFHVNVNQYLLFESDISLYDGNRKLRWYIFEWCLPSPSTSSFLPHGTNDPWCTWSSQAPQLNASRPKDEYSCPSQIAASFLWSAPFRRAWMPQKSLADIVQRSCQHIGSWAWGGSTIPRKHLGLASAKCGSGALEKLQPQIPQWWA